jgi:phospholipid/cholesterol/gamma-HCH transport system substrate-binding protein
MKQLEQMAANADATVKDLKEAAANPNSPMGVLMRDEKTGAEIKRTISNLEKSSETLNENLEALKYSFLLRKAFKRQAKAEGNP